MDNAFGNWSLDEKGLPYLIGTQCGRCKEFHFPPSQTCRTCLSDETEAVHFGRKGVLYSFSIIHVPSLGFESPYAIGYVDLNYGTRLYTLLSEWENQKLENGMEMELAINRIKKDENGHDVTGYTYRPKIVVF